MDKGTPDGAPNQKALYIIKFVASSIRALTIVIAGPGQATAAREFDAMMGIRNTDIAAIKAAR